jgi:hypothetical protein
MVDAVFLVLLENQEPGRQQYSVSSFPRPTPDPGRKYSIDMATTWICTAIAAAVEQAVLYSVTVNHIFKKIRPKA